MKKTHPATSPTYNHAYALGFSIKSNTEDGADITQEQFCAAIKERLANLMTCNELVEALGVPMDTFLEDEPAPGAVGKIWWSADNLDEALRMQALYLRNGAQAVELSPEPDRPIVAVVITLDKTRAKEILGCDVGPEEWLDLSPEEPGCAASAPAL